MYPALVILVVAAMFWGLFHVVKSFGHYTHQILTDNARTRQSCEESAQRVIRTERRIAEDELATIELMREMMKSTSEKSA